MFPSYFNPDCPISLVPPAVREVAVVRLDFDVSAQVQNELLSQAPVNRPRILEIVRR